jgi:diguanylate cyclase (GGDEF)-like protein
LIQIYVREFGSLFAGKVNILYFKYLPTVYSLVATQCYGLPLDMIKGVGAKLEAREMRDYRQTLALPQGPESLRKVMGEALKVEHFRSQPLPLIQEIEGLFVFWGHDFGHVSDECWKLYFAILKDFYERYHLRKRVFDLEVHDELTHLHNGTAFQQKIEEELARSRRLASPLSLLKLRLDRIQQNRDQLGDQALQVVLKSLAAILKKTSRVNDSVCRTDEFEFSIILPHTPLKGASIRAERLRRIIESTAFALEPIKITASFGVGEYPSHCGTAADLIHSSTQALNEVHVRGGNKVCLASAPHGFKPDFTVAT